MRNGENNVNPYFRDYFESYGVATEPLPGVYDEHTIQVALKTFLGAHEYSQARVLPIPAQIGAWLPQWLTQTLAASKVAASLQQNLMRPYGSEHTNYRETVPEGAKDMVVVAYPNASDIDGSERQPRSAILFKPRDEAEAAFMVETQLRSCQIDVYMAVAMGALSPVDGLPRIVTEAYRLLRLKQEDLLRPHERLPFNRLVDEMMAHKRRACGAILHSEEIRKAILKRTVDIDHTVQAWLRGVPDIAWVQGGTVKLRTEFEANGWKGDPAWNMFMRWVNSMTSPQADQSHTRQIYADNLLQPAVLQL